MGNGGDMMSGDQADYDMPSGYWKELAQRSRLRKLEERVKKLEGK